LRDSNDDDVLLFKGSVFEHSTRPDRPDWDDEEPDHGASSYPDADHGPGPVPDWVITSGFARDTELGLLKTGKEAEVHLVERRWDDRVNLLAAKRYRRHDRGGFKRDSSYREGRRVRDSREMRAMAKGTVTGLAFRAGYWARNEMTMLGRLWEAGASVPYPVQISGTELIMQYLGDESSGAPRLVNAQLDRDGIEEMYHQAVEVLRIMTLARIVHADLSPYNLLVWDERLWVIDLPQAVDIAVNPNGYEFLHRDVVNVLTWFQRKGIECEPDEVFATLL
jgi:RIO kinase 1